MTYSLDERCTQFEQLAQHLPMAAAIFDRDLHYIFANDHWLHDFHLNRDEIIGKLHYDVFPEIGDDWKAIHQRCLAGHIHTDDEVEFRRMDGSVDWLRREIRPWYQSDETVGGLIMYISIISEQKRARDALQAERWFLRQVIDLNTSFIFAKDLDGRYTLVNKALADWYGSSPEEMVGKYDEDYNVNREETVHFRSDDLEVVRTLTPKFIPEEPVSSSTGVTHWYQTIKVPLIFEDGSVQMLGIATDITERKRTQDRLQAQHEFLRQVIDLNTSLIFAKDEEGNFLLVNKTLADAFGAKPDEMVGKSDVDYNTDPEQVKRIYADDMEVIRTRTPKFIAQEAITGTFTNETRWYQTTKVPLILSDGTVQLLGVATDITERKHAEEQLQKLVIQEQEARQAAETASKMKDLFLANMSHELRTPLNAIIGFLREMIYSEQLNSDNTHMAERCLANSKRLNMLVNSVLDLSRLAVNSLELVILPVDLKELAHFIREDLSIQAKDKGLQFELEIDTTLPAVIQHDEERLTQIMSNLLVNAIKYTREGEVRLALKRADDHLIIEVSDTGIGIPDDMQDFIFENFTQLKHQEPNQGAGLGLSIVRNLSELMNGRIFLKSKPDEFTIFTVELPLNLEDTHT